VDRLRAQGFFVERGQGDVETLWSRLTTGLPVIVAVRTDDLVHWIKRTDIHDEEKATDHAVVVVGLDEQTVYVNDPDFEQAPQMIDLDEFLLAWLERDYEYVVIGLEEFEETM
jgi:uncharacterized protein YvpB